MSNLILPKAFQSVIGLGEPLQLYKGGGFSRWGGLVFLALGALLAIWLLFTDTSLFGILLLLILGLVAWHIMARWNEAAVVYEEGLARYDGKSVRVFRWDEIASIAMNVTIYRYLGILRLNTTHRYVLTHANGKQLNLDDHFPQVEELFDQIRKQTFRPILARSCRAFDAGDTVEFGELALSPALGIVKGKKSFPWSQIGRVWIDQGTVNIKPKQDARLGSLSAPVTKILNLDVFLAMVREMVELSKQGV